MEILRLSELDRSRRTLRARARLRAPRKALPGVLSLALLLLLLALLAACLRWATAFMSHGAGAVNASSF